MASKPHILFVDDELSILKSIRRELRAHASEWDMSFYESPQEALSALSETKPMVVVSDKRMKQMDGVEFLGAVRERWPQAIRVLLTGDTSPDIAAELVLLAHLLIAKPYEPEDMMTIMHRAKCLEALPVGDEVKRALGGIVDIPVLPKLYIDLKHLLKDEYVTSKDIVALISHEPVVLAKLVQLANSSFLGFSTPSASPLEAVVRLGIDMISKLVLTFSVFQQSTALDEVFREALLHESVLAAEICQQISINNGDSKKETEIAFLMGILHNIGYVVPVDLDLELSRHKSDKGPRQEDAIGAYLLSLWDFNRDFVDAIYFQSVPKNCPNLTKFIGYLHVADCVIKSRQSEVSNEQLLASFNYPLLENLGIWEAVVTTTNELP